MKTYALVLGLEDAERDQLVQLLRAPDLAHLHAALLELPGPRPWWDRPAPFTARAATAPITIYKAAEGEVLRTVNATWVLHVSVVQTINRRGWFKVNDAPDLWVRAEDCVPE
jgi:hypothetical protein